MSKLRVFISAYACEPNLGSEIGVGWHWVLEMSRYFELWVLTRKSNRPSIEPWIKEHPEYAGIHFLYYDWPKWARFWKKGLRGVRTYYNLWQYCTNRIVRHTMRKEGIRIFHHLTYGNMLWKVSSYGQRQFFIWGPVGGLETIPAEYSKHYDWKSRLIEAMRRMVVTCLSLNVGFQNRCRRADLILCKTDVTRLTIPKPYRDRAVLFTDVAVKERADNRTVDNISNHDTIKFLTVGRLDAWRGFDLIIEAMAIAVKQDSRVQLTIVGKGLDKDRLQRLIQHRQLEHHIRLAGGVTMQEYEQLLAASDCVINGSLKEGAVTVSFDCLAQGKPLICIDTTGYTRYFSEDYAMIIPRGKRDQTIGELANAIVKMTNPELRQHLGEQAKQAGRRFTWSQRGKEIRNIILKTYGD